MNLRVNNWVKPVFWISFSVCGFLALFDLAMILFSASQENALSLNTAGMTVSIIRYALVFCSLFFRGKIGIGMLVIYFTLFNFFLAIHVGD